MTKGPQEKTGRVPLREGEDSAGAKGVVRAYSSQDLFGPGSEVHIVHEGAIYRLRITRQGKLILNK